MIYIEPLNNTLRYLYEVFTAIVLPLVNYFSKFEKSNV